ncbi:MAG: hypothetical protein M3310_00110, partial [Actinomycetota bacterium]|nr:hypothetical protein [Actinomycetota bacterium]
SNMSVKLPERSLRVALATVLLASGVRLVEAPAWDVWVPLILTAGAVLAGVVELKRLNGRGRAHRPRLTGAGPPG